MGSTRQIGDIFKNSNVCVSFDRLQPGHSSETSRRKDRQSVGMEAALAVVALCGWQTLQLCVELQNRQRDVQATWLACALRTVQRLAQVGRDSKYTETTNKKFSCQEHRREQGDGQSVTFTLTYHEQPPPDLGGEAPFFAPEVIHDLLTVPHVYLSDAGSGFGPKFSCQWPVASRSGSSKRERLGTSGFRVPARKRGHP